MNKAYVSIGYTKEDLSSYRTTDFTKLTGADIKAIDGAGNMVEVNVREAGIGYRISVNGKEIANGRMGIYQTEDSQS